MATITTLIAGGELFKLDPALDDQELRLIYTSEQLKDWFLNVLPELGSTWAIETTPAEQMDALVATFASGDTLTFAWQFKPLNPVGKGVWELKTADLRIFGWFPAKDCFIGVVADSKQRILDHGLYAGYRETVVHFRNQLNLDEPKFIAGENPNDVVSNYDLPP